MYVHRNSSLNASELDTHTTELWACTNPFGNPFGYHQVLYKERKRRPSTEKERDAYPLLDDPDHVSPVRAFCGTKFNGADGEETDRVPVFREEEGRLGLVWTHDDGNETFHYDYW